MLQSERPFFLWRLVTSKVETYEYHIYILRIYTSRYLRTESRVRVIVIHHPFITDIPGGERITHMWYMNVCAYFAIPFICLRPSFFSAAYFSRITQIRGHIAGSSPSSPLCKPYNNGSCLDWWTFLSREEFSYFFPLGLARTVLTHAIRRRTQQLRVLFILSFLQISSKSHQHYYSLHVSILIVNTVWYVVAF